MWCVGGDRDTSPCRQRPSLLRERQHGAAAGSTELSPGMVCQSSGSAGIPVLLGSLVGRQHSLPGTALAAASCSCCVLTSFPDFLSPHPCKTGETKDKPESSLSLA